MRVHAQNFAHVHTNLHTHMQILRMCMQEITKYARGRCTNALAFFEIQECFTV